LALNEDSRFERRRLEQHYRKMADEELLAIASDMGALTIVAREVMKIELAKRGLHAEGPIQATGEVLPPKDEKLVTIARFITMGQALIAKGVLDSAGITCFLIHDVISRIYVPTFSGGVGLQVDQGDADTAQQLLSEPMADDFEVEGIGEYHQPACPNCGSMEVDLFSLEAPDEVGDWWKCRRCHHQWMVAAEDAADMR
jgi:hypothetical protein